MDKTVAKRVENMRRRRIADGWCEVRIWVPTKKNAEEVREFGRKCREVFKTHSKE